MRVSGLVACVELFWFKKEIRIAGQPSCFLKQSGARVTVDWPTIESDPEFAESAINALEALVKSLSAGRGSGGE